MGRGLLGNAPQWPLRELEPSLATLSEGGPEPLDEVLIGIGWVELHDLVAAAVLLTPLGDALGHIGLAGARRPLKDRLSLILQPVNDLLQLAWLPQKLLGQRLYIGWRPRGR